MIFFASQEHSSIEFQVISLENIYMVNGSCTSTAQLCGCRWIWKDSFGKIQLMGTPKFKKARDYFIFGSRSTTMGNREHTSTFVMSAFWDWLQGSDRDDKGALSLAKFCNRIGSFPDFEIFHILRVHNGISDLLAKIARVFHRELCYIVCSIRVWLLRPPQIWVIK